MSLEYIKKRDFDCIALDRVLADLCTPLENSDHGENINVRDYFQILQVVLAGNESPLDEIVNESQADIKEVQQDDSS